MSNSKRYDIIVYGASGFTGKYILRQLIKYQLKNLNDPLGLKLAIAGRNSIKLSDVADEMLEEFSEYKGGIDCLIADVDDVEQLTQVAEQAKVLISAAGPYKKIGINVVEACINGRTHYVDITGEIDFVERSFCEFDRKASEKDIVIAHCCGYDSTPADLGTLLVKEHLVNKGIKPKSIDTYVELQMKDYRGQLNFTTYQTAIYAITSSNPYRKKFKSLLPNVQSLSPRVVSKIPHYNKEIDGIVFPLPMSDGPIVRMTQKLVQRESSSPNTTFSEDLLKLPSCSTESYFKFPNTFVAILTTILFIVIGIMSKLPYGKWLLLNYPHIFTASLVRPLESGGPSKEGIDTDRFKMTFIAKGTKEDTNEEISVKAELVGPEVGYNLTSKIAAFSAITLLKEKVQDHQLKINGVLTPGTALYGTKFLDNLIEFDDSIKFTIHDTL